MTTLTFDTSERRCQKCDAGPLGNCGFHGGETPRDTCPLRRPFVQGYADAIRAEIGSDAPFSPDALALILRDCEACGFFSQTEEGGRFFWAQRQAGARHWAARFPPLRPFLNDAGQIDFEALT